MRPTSIGCLPLRPPRRPGRRAASRGARPSRLILLAYAVAALVVLAAGVLAMIAFRRLRLRRAEPEPAREGGREQINR